jgi:8-oxo-dGTP pyrophosphatase MutT (NUDIX family)
MWDRADMEEIPSDFQHPPLRATTSSLRAHFASEAALQRRPLRNPHHELEISEADRQRARPAAVLIPVIEHDAGLTLLLTRRHEEISFPGHLCFPGGRCDPGDSNATATALRESHEEIDLEPAQVEVLGELGSYVSKNGFHITPVVGLLRPPLDLSPHPREVEEILEIPHDFALRSDSYRLARRDAEAGWAVYFLEYEQAFVTGPTISLLMGLYEALLETHAQES